MNINADKSSNIYIEVSIILQLLANPFEQFAGLSYYVKFYSSRSTAS